MDTTTIVAWWGAVLSSVVFLWDIYKWWTAGPKIRFSVQSGMESINMPEYDGKTLILAKVTNYGDRPTTITNLGFLYFGSIWSKLRKKSDKAFIIPNPSTVQRLPFELKQGSIWSGVAIQDSQVEALAMKGRLYCVLYHSHDEKPIMARVEIRSNTSLQGTLRDKAAQRP
jgi:hypothetical protein